MGEHCGQVSAFEGVHYRVRGCRSENVKVTQALMSKNWGVQYRDEG